MQTWAFFWAGVLIGVFTVFAVLAVVISIGGFFDVRSLFVTMDRQHGGDSDHDRAAAGPQSGGEG